MNSAAILSIKPQYANQILAGTKRIELRKSAMGLGEEDVVLVYASAPEQTLKFWFRGLIWLKDDFGRYQRLLAELSSPLPQDLFPQQRLALDLSSPAAPAK
jgi:hypothetical protein